MSKEKITVKDILSQIKGKGKAKQKGGGAGKIGRNLKSPAMQRYKGEHRDERNKLRKLAKRIKEHPADEQAKAALRAIQGA